MCPGHVVGNAPLVGAQGFEPRSNRTPAHREDQSQAPVSIRAHRHYERRPGSQRPPVSVHCGWQLRTPGWIRTSGFDTRNVALSPLSYGGVAFGVDRRGIEPRTSGLQGETVHQHPARVRVRADRGDRTRVFGVEDRREQPASPDPRG